MNRSTQLILESAIIGALFIGIAAGGAVSTQSLPASWKALPNPANASPGPFDRTGFALLYNATLSALAQREYSNVSYYLAGFRFLSYPSSLQTAVSSANSEITSMSGSLSLSLSMINQTEGLIQSGHLLNASSAAQSVCQESLVLRTALDQFANTTTPQFASSGVPVSMYNASLIGLGNDVSHVSLQCNTLVSIVRQLILNSTTFHFGLSTPQTSVKTGGNLILSGSISVNGTGLVGELIIFYFNDTYLGNATTASGGSYYANLSLPFIYEPEAQIRAIAPANLSLDLPIPLASNTVDVSLLFNATRIIMDSFPSSVQSQSVSETAITLQSSAYLGEPRRCPIRYYTE